MKSYIVQENHISYSCYFFIMLDLFSDSDVSPLKMFVILVIYCRITRVYEEADHASCFHLWSQSVSVSYSYSYSTNLCVGIFDIIFFYTDRVL